MKVVLLAGGLGTRLSEETDFRPKPMVEIGNKPILWHIMKMYSAFGLCEFIICLGYKGYLIREYFANFLLHNADFTVSLRDGKIEFHTGSQEDWKVTLVETGEKTETGGRIKRVRDYIGDETFCMTYGDGLSSVDVNRLVAFHRSEGRAATLTTVRPPGRFGAVSASGGRVERFIEKPLGDGAAVNGGFFVLEPTVFDRIAGDTTIWEREPLEGLARDNELSAFMHDGFWQPMDTLRDKRLLDELWESGAAPWKVW